MSQFKWTVYGYYQEEEGKKEKRNRVSREKVFYEEQAKVIGLRVAWEKEIAKQIYCSFKKYSVRQLESQYMFLVKNAYIM